MDQVVRLTSTTVRCVADARGEEGDGRNDGGEANPPRREVQDEPEERDDRDAEAERQGDPLDPVDFRLLWGEGAWEECCHEDVAWDKEDEEDGEDVANIQDQ